MFIATKDTKVTAIHEVEWQCRRKAKGLDKSAYWTWLATVTSEDENGHKTYDFSGEDYEILETDAPFSYQDEEGNTIGFNQSGHIDGQNYFLKWDGSKIIKDDDALTAYQTAEKWKSIRNNRNRRLAETDHMALTDTSASMSNDMKLYRQRLRNIPQENSDPDNITWPEKP
tara:strand:+ start:306 stop:818 length:513 start_codon:yes stop_codon:yes gene_type:complete